mgnify:CR=1 FL=1
MNLRAVPPDTLPGGVNMAVDYYLTAGFEPGEGPICRFYRWSDPTVTAGRTVPEDAALSAARAHLGARLFRRPTGGGVVFHGGQLSFSVIWPRTLPALRDLRQSYISLHLVLKEALADSGVPVVQAAGPAPGRGLFCAASVERGDLTTVDGQKVAGGAQWRAAGTVLYQGHLWLPDTPGMEQAVAGCLADYLGLPAVDWALPVCITQRAREDQARWEIPVP